MRSRSFTILTYFVFPIVLFGMGCATIADQGNNLFKRKGYAEAIDKYKLALNKDSNNVGVAINMAVSYLKNNQFETVEDLYAKIIENPEAESVQKLHYAQQLMKSGKYEQAKTILEIFKSEQPDDERADNFIKSIDGIDNFFVTNDSIAVKNLNINSAEDDFSPTIYKNGLVFASARKRNSFVTFLHAWNNKPFTNIYFSQGYKDQFPEPKLFGGKLQTKYHNGAVTFTNDGGQMYFTRNNIVEGKVRKSKEDLVNLKIFSASKLGSEWDSDWGPEINFVYNSDEYHCAHPTISEDGQKLYFSSDMPANLFGKDRPICYGGMDLYVCEKSSEGWGIPKNLGPEINTPGHEIFSFIQEDGSLFFSSDGHVGFGGLDLYHSTMHDKKWQSPKNLGSPINWKYDDFGITVSEDGVSGYFCSNRPFGKGNDDIYFFEGLKIPIRLEVLVFDQTTDEPLDNVTVLLSQNDNSPENFTTNSEGMLEKDVFLNQNFRILANKEGYNEVSVNLTADAYNEDSITLIKIPLEIIRNPLEIDSVDKRNSSDPIDKIAPYKIPNPLDTDIAEVDSVDDRNKSNRIDPIHLGEIPNPLDSDLIFPDIDKYYLGTIPMNKIPRIKIAALLNEGSTEIGGNVYTKNDIKLNKIPIREIPNPVDIGMIFSNIDNYFLDTIPMARIPRIKITSLLNDGIVEIGGSVYTRSDIKLKRIPPAIKSIILSGGVIALDSKKPISGAEVILRQIDNLTNTLKTFTTGVDGKFSIDLLPNCSYSISATKVGCISSEEKISTKSMTNSLTRNVHMHCEEEIMKIEIENIFFDFNKDNIRRDAAIELDKVVKVMNDNPKMKIELGSHTDSRGNDDYNLYLSDKRAKSSAAYIVSQGIDSSRITGKGYGENQLINRCANGVKCSEEEHQENRRTEFRIISIE